MNECYNETSAEAEWETEIDARVKEITEGRLKPVSADKVIARLREKLAIRRAVDSTPCLAS